MSKHYIVLTQHYCNRLQNFQEILHTYKRFYAADEEPFSETGPASSFFLQHQQILQLSRLFSIVTARLLLTFITTVPIY